MKSLNAYTVSRAMLILGDRNSCTRIAREMGTQREAVNYWLTRMRQDRLVERDRRHHGSGGGYEWWLTDKGQALAIYTRPDDAEAVYRPDIIRYDHRPLSAALGMPNRIDPPLADRVHFLETRR